MANINDPIFLSLLDNDKYKLSMLMANLLRYPSADARYKFNLRTTGIDLTPLIPALREQVNMLGDLKFTENELQYLKQESHITNDFLDYLKDFQLDPRHIRISADSSCNGGVSIEAIGPMLKTSMWEIFILAMVNELYFRMTEPEPDYEEGRKRLMAKIDLIKQRNPGDDFRLIDFGTRRRFSRDWQAEVMHTLSRMLPEYFAGTSNYYLAREMGLTPFGTMAHEYLQLWQGIVHPLDATSKALRVWPEVFKGELSVALTDVISMDSFCNEMDLLLARIYSGFRQDSGCPELWANKLINRLNELNVPSTSKDSLWSDSLDAQKSIDLYDKFTGKFNTCNFCIGTNLTNDLSYKPLNCVMKVVEVNGRPVAKLSDSPGKTMCEDDNYVAFLRDSYGK